jgi:sulfate transport system permease protein
MTINHRREDSAFWCLRFVFMTPFRFMQHSVLPGFGLTLGVTLTYLGLLVMLPLTMLVISTASMTFGEFWKVVSSPPVVAAFKLSFGASLIAASINAIFGFIVAWTLVRYPFPGRRFVDALIDIPFAMPTAISGIALTWICSEAGWVGSWFAPYNIEIAYTPIGIVIALTFIGLPFVVRTLQPTLEDLDKEVEEAAETLGATRWQTFWKIIFPSVFPFFSPSISPSRFASDKALRSVMAAIFSLSYAASCALV